MRCLPQDRGRRTLLARLGVGAEFGNKRKEVAVAEFDRPIHDVGLELGRHALAPREHDVARVDAGEGEERQSDASLIGRLFNLSLREESYSRQHQRDLSARVAPTLNDDRVR